MGSVGSQATELLDAKEVFVDEALEEVGSGRGGAHFHAAAHAVEVHLNHRVAGLPANGAVLSIVAYPPDACGSLNEGLVSVGIVLGREVVNLGVLVEIVDDIGLALGGDAVADVVVGVGEALTGDELVARVVGVGVGDGGGISGAGFDDGRAATEGVGGVIELREHLAIGGVFDARQEVALGFIGPFGGAVAPLG